MARNKQKFDDCATNIQKYVFLERLHDLTNIQKYVFLEHQERSNICLYINIYNVSS